MDEGSARQTDGLINRTPAAFAVDKQVRVRGPVTAGLAIIAVLASTVAAAQAKPAPDFSGKWNVEWCDKTRPEVQCGGFSVDLRRRGELLTGESFGARVGLSQIDEGGLVHGIVIGSTAVMTIQSLRSGSIYLVKASIVGDCMHWQVRDTVHSAEQDIDIVAFDDVLSRMPAASPASGAEAASKVACRSTTAN